MRGKVGLLLPLLTFVGITPACAGKSNWSHRFYSGSRDHPRVCGEKLGVVTEYLPKIRITPACAGKSAYLVRYACPYEDHPRVCGEKLISNTGSRIPMGSPPRVRGKVWRTVAAAGDPGITPACAGKSWQTGETTTDSEDHPRVCGEKRVQRGDVDQCSGSPPRVRGKVTVNGQTLSDFRITPACAGKSGSAVKYKCNS